MEAGVSHEEGNDPRHAAHHAEYRRQVEADPRVIEFRALLRSQGRTGPWETRVAEPSRATAAPAAPPAPEARHVLSDEECLEIAVKYAQEIADGK